MRKKFSRLTMACIPMMACGGGKTTVDAHIATHDSHTVDATPACAAKPSYAVTFGSNDVQQAFNGSNSMEAKDYYLGNISEANPIDLLDIELWIGGTGTDFPTAVTTGTFDLSAKGDNSYDTCDACVLVWPQMPLDGSGNFAPSSTYFDNQQYMAKSGSMTLSSVNGHITGTLSNVALRQVDVGSAAEVDDPSACATTISAASFTATYGSAGAFTGKSDDGFSYRFTLHHRYH